MPLKMRTARESRPAQPSLSGRQRAELRLDATQVTGRALGREQTARPLELRAARLAVALYLSEVRERLVRPRLEVRTALAQHRERVLELAARVAGAQLDERL